MTNSEFVHIQDEILQLSGRDLASALKRSPSDIVRWRKDVEIPSYIELLLHYLVKEKLGTLTLTLTVNDINAIIRLAAERGLTFEGLLISMIRSAITSDTTPAAPILFPADSLRVAEEPVEYITKARSKAVPALSPRTRSTPNPPEKK